VNNRTTLEVSVVREASEVPKRVVKTLSGQENKQIMMDTFY
jgi:hypothetical protein